MQYVNLTPHVVNVYNDEEVVMSLAPSGCVVRIDESVTPSVELDGIQFVDVSLGEVNGLPEEEEDTVFVVSMSLLMGMKAAGSNRQDCVYPFGQVRDDQGRIIGCRSLASIV